MRHFLVSVFLLSWACLFGAGPVGASVLSDSANSPVLDAIYVNANVGEAAGGHTAFRLGETVFHYQFQESGIFILVREPWSNFRLVYNELCNRSIFITSLPLTPDLYQKLNYHFNTLLMLQEENLHSLVANRKRLNLVAKLSSESRSLRIDGLGFFDRNRSGDPQLENLRQCIDRILGPTFRGQEKERVKSEIAGFELSPDRLCDLDSLLEALTLQAGLQILEKGCPLAETALIPPLTGETRLTLAEVKALQDYRRKLQNSIITILNSQRPDRGAALLLQIARWLVAKRSLNCGRMLTLDPFPDRARIRAVAETEIAPEVLESVQAQLIGAVAAQRKNFCHESEYPEITYAFLEKSRGRLAEFDKAMRGAESVRVEPELGLPARGAELSLTEIALLPARLTAAATKLRSEIRAGERQVKRNFHYNLMTSNCATELIRALNLAFANPEAERQALGGRLEPQADFNFTPFMFYRNVRKNLNCAAEKYLPSRRLRQLQELYGEEKPLSIRLREGNTFTSTLYKIRSEDTPFIFFTDNGWGLRPLAGIVNLSYAVLYGTAGILTLPFTGWENLHQGLRGMFYSLPEIFFGNIRKGTYAAAAVASSRAAP